jgi:sporulation protein YlmC with PRC-barrel domain
MKAFITALTIVAGVAVASSAAAQYSTPTTTDQSSTSTSTGPKPAGPSPSAGGSQAGGTQAGGSQAAASGVLIDASSIVGATVRSQGKDIGRVERLMVDPKDGRVRTVVVQVGGTLGVGGKSVSLPWESVKLAQDGNRIVVTAEQQMLEQAPAASPRTDSKSDSKSDNTSDKK